MQLSELLKPHQKEALINMMKAKTPASKDVKSTIVLKKKEDTSTKEKTK